MAQIKCEGLELGYNGNVVVNNLNFEVNRGDYLCIIGENGSGKSTLVRTLLNLIKPISGKIITGNGLNAYEIGYLPQQTLVQRDFPASVEEIVLSGCISQMKNRPFYNKNDRESAYYNMDRLGIRDLSKRCYRELSGGQQQRVLLARALCSATKMLLLDEPVAGLDPKATVEMYSIIEHLNKQDKMTIIMVSHDIKEAIEYATHILHVGRIPRFFGTKSDYINSAIGRQYISVMGGEYNA